MEKIKKHIYPIIIAALAILLIGYIYLDNTKQAHDLPFHLANIHNIVSNNLKITPVMPNLANNLGYGIYIFYPILTHLVYAIIAWILQFIRYKNNRQPINNKHTNINSIKHINV